MTSAALTEIMLKNTGCDVRENVTPLFISIVSIFRQYWGEIQNLSIGFFSINDFEF